MSRTDRLVSQLVFLALAGAVLVRLGRWFLEGKRDS